MKGLIFIPDISGFTNFVKTIDQQLGVSITSDLLNEIIDHNPLELQLSEIEGDAVLFYCIGKPFSLNQIIDSFEHMFVAFDAKYQQWKIKYRLQLDLSLKLVVHYGDIMVYDIKGFRKLYGETVIESHRLLKAESTALDYILLTEDYLNALHQDFSDVTVNVSSRGYTSYKSHTVTDMKSISYYLVSTLKKASRLSKTFATSDQMNKDALYLAVGV